MNICAYTCEPHDRPHVRNIDPFQLTVIGRTNDYIVIDRSDNRLFVTYNAVTPIDAACSYINWVYGRVRTCEWNAKEADWYETDDFIPAAHAYDYHAGPLGWKLVED